MEHSGFTFQQNADKASEMLTLHSGGKVSEAMQMALQADITQLGYALIVEGASRNDPHPIPSSPPRRRTKRDKDRTLAVLPPLPEKKKLFCCF